MKLEPMQMPVGEVAAVARPVKKVAKGAKAPSVSSGNIAAMTLTDVLKDRLLELRRRGYNRLFQPVEGRRGTLSSFRRPKACWS